MWSPTTHMKKIKTHSKTCNFCHLSHPLRILIHLSGQLVSWPVNVDCKVGHPSSLNQDSKQTFLLTMENFVASEQISHPHAHVCQDLHFQLKKEATWLACSCARKTYKSRPMWKYCYLRKKVNWWLYENSSRETACFFWGTRYAGCYSVRLNIAILKHGQ